MNPPKYSTRHAYGARRFRRMLDSTRGEVDRRIRILKGSIKKYHTTKGYRPITAMEKLNA